MHPVAPDVLASDAIASDAPGLEALLFDFDGTLADTFEAIVAILNRLADEFGYPTADPADIERLRTLSSRQILQAAGVSWLKLPFLIRRVQAELQRDIHQLHPVPGMDETLLALRDRGYRLGIVTTNTRENVSAFVRAADWEGRFDFIDASNRLFGKHRALSRAIEREGLARQQVAYVGDETRDVEAARRAGVTSIAVAWGFNKASALAAIAPDVLVHQPAELLAAVEALARPDDSPAS